ncbi:STAS domain-containing protein [Bacillus sp. 2205SS5-2]|uniref:STAS domain-containing protein n=1 Tax=Bacillus sp. 2205SS5-2 TaxID=3109031 RepID=UPI003007C3DA
MKQELTYLGEHIIQTKFEIARKVHESRIVFLSKEQLAQLRHVEDEVINIRAQFIGMFGEILRDQENEEQANKIISNWGETNGKLFFEAGTPLNEALKDTRFYRKYIWDALKEAMKVRKMTVETIFDTIELINPLLDFAVYSFSLSFIHHYQQTLELAKSALFEVSLPIVPVAKGIAIIPVIGKLDSDRAVKMMEETLNSASKLNLNWLILDLSGVVEVDTMVADQLFKIISALKLLGVDTVITGIRPVVAHTVISIGINFGSLHIKSNLQEAMQFLTTRVE